MSRSRNSARSHGNRHRGGPHPGCGWDCYVCHPDILLPKYRETRNEPIPWHDGFHEPRCIIASPKRMRELGKLFVETCKRGVA